MCVGRVARPRLRKPHGMSFYDFAQRSARDVFSSVVFADDDGPPRLRGASRASCPFASSCCADVMHGLPFDCAMRTGIVIGAKLCRRQSLRGRGLNTNMTLAQFECT